MRMRSLRSLLVLAATVLVGFAREGCAQQSRPAFRFAEATIADVHSALRARTTTCHAIVAGYLARIERYDKHAPALNAIVLVNPNALAIADSLDRQHAATRSMSGSLFCIPIIVKDNFETAGLQTTAGSLALRGWTPREDATMVKRLKDAGAIVLAKSNMAELAFSPFETVSSILPGYTKNPYALDRVTAGSSGGTGASVAASFGVVGLGTDTGNSIRGPSGHNNLVGIRSTMGLTSRAGIVPLNLASDIAGPMARTVADAVAVFQVVAGYDPDDSVTTASRDRPTPDYRNALRRDGLAGARIGVLTPAYLTATTDTEVVRVFARALADLRKQGATVIDSVMVPELDSLRRASSGGCNPFKFDFERFLASRNDSTLPVKTLAELIRSRRFHPSIEVRLTAAQAESLPPERNPGCEARDRFRAGLRTAVLRAMDANRLDALVYPTWSNPPRLIGDLNTPAGDNNQLFSPSTGYPAITVPMGYTRGVLPAGLQFFGRPWSEETLIRLAYSYEQSTHWRREPRFIVAAH
jgi:Asp-tRNA(Asn)/Glu-tRNA(Gln) amidotransferase A subunit family amidase